MASQTMNKNISAAFEIVEQNKQVESKIEEQFTQVTEETKNNSDSTSVTVLSDFPELGTKLTKEQQRLLVKSNQNDVRKFSEKVNTKDLFSLDPRSESFASMADKEKVASSLTRTKACRIVTGPFLNPKEGEEPKFGVCTRENCSFAHSESERQAPLCGFDGNCRFIHGKIDRNTDKKIPNSNCMFRHSSESVNDWIKRSGVKLDPLPKTNEFSRKPRQSTSNFKTDIKSVDITDTTVVTSKTSPIKLFVPKSERPEKPTTEINTPVKVRKSRWDQKTNSIPVTPVTPIKETKSRRKISYSSSDSSSDSESETESNHKSKSKTDKNKEQVIRVPNQELAKMAIQMAFESGNYNIRVVVE